MTRHYGKYKVAKSSFPSRDRVIRIGTPSNVSELDYLANMYRLAMERVHYAMSTY
jgi:hypothetical protein